MVTSDSSFALDLPISSSFEPREICRSGCMSDLWDKKFSSASRKCCVDVGLRGFFRRVVSALRASRPHFRRILNLGGSVMSSSESDSSVSSTTILGGGFLVFFSGADDDWPSSDVAHGRPTRASIRALTTFSLYFDANQYRPWTLRTSDAFACAPSALFLVHQPGQVFLRFVLACLHPIRARAER